MVLKRYLSECSGLWALSIYSLSKKHSHVINKDLAITSDLSSVGSHVCESVTTVLENTSKKAKVENRDRKLPTIGSSLRFSNPEQFWEDD